MPAPPQERVVRFDAFTLDLDQCVLRRGTVELHLRPKAFDTLRYLAERPGRLLSKDELIAAVWPDVTITDDSLVRCIKDIREALGDTDHRIIKTIRGRGYLFAADRSTTERRAAANTPELHSWPRIQSLMDAARLRALSAGWRGFALLTAGVVLVAAVMVWTVRTPATSAAAHYTTLANAIIDKERTPRARNEALALYNKALALNPDFVPALIGSAHAIIVEAIEHSMPAADRAIRLAQAEVAILRAIKLEPSNARAHRWHGILLRAQGKPERAIPALERALALTPNSGWVHADLGRAKIEAGRADEAIGHYETALSLSPADPLAFIWCFQAGWLPSISDRARRRCNGS